MKVGVLPAFIFILASGTTITGGEFFCTAAGEYRSAGSDNSRRSAGVTGRGEKVTEFIRDIIPTKGGFISGEPDMIILARRQIRHTGYELDRGVHACRRYIIPANLKAASSPVQI